MAILATYRFPDLQNILECKLAFESNQDPTETYEQVQAISLLEMSI